MTFSAAKTQGHRAAPLLYRRRYLESRHHLQRSHLERYCQLHLRLKLRRQVKRCRQERYRRDFFPYGGTTSKSGRRQPQRLLGTLTGFNRPVVIGKMEYDFRLFGNTFAFAPKIERLLRDCCTALPRAALGVNV